MNSSPVTNMPQLGGGDSASIAALAARVTALEVTVYAPITGLVTVVANHTIAINNINIQITNINNAISDIQSGALYKRATDTQASRSVNNNVGTYWGAGGNLGLRWDTLTYNALLGNIGGDGGPLLFQLKSSAPAPDLQVASGTGIPLHLQVGRAANVGGGAGLAGANIHLWGGGGGDTGAGTGGTGGGTILHAAPAGIGTVGVGVDGTNQSWGTMTLTDMAGTGHGWLQAVAGKNLILNTTGIGFSVIPKNDIQATPTDALWISNTQNSLVGTQVQMSPSVRFRANVWDTGAAANRTSDWAIESQPSPGNPPTYTFFLRHSANGGAFSNIASWSNVAGAMNYGFTDWSGIAAPALSAGGQGRIYFDSGANVFMVSQNGSAYAALGVGSIGGTGTANSIPKFTAATTIGDSSITDNGTQVLLTGTTFSVNGVTQIGTLDAFGRNQIWHKAASSVLRLGSDTVDGDPTSVDSEGIIVYFPSTDQLARIKADRFGLSRASDASLYYFRVDQSAMFYRANPPGGVTWFNVNRSTGLTTLRNDGIAAASTDMVAISNPTVSTAIIPVQMSPRLRFNANVWDTGTVANKTSDWIMESLPVSGNPATYQLNLSHSIDGAAYTLIAQWANAAGQKLFGPLTLTDTTGTSTGIIKTITGQSLQVIAGGGSSFWWNGSALTPDTTNSRVFGDTTHVWHSIYLGQEEIAPITTSGAYWGNSQEARLFYNKNYTGLPTNCLILALNTTGNAGINSLAMSSAAITNFAAAANTQGQNVYIATQTGGTNGGASPKGGNLSIVTGQGIGGGAPGTITLTSGAGYPDGVINVQAQTIDFGPSPGPFFTRQRISLYNFILTGATEFDWTTGSITDPLGTRLTQANGIQVDGGNGVGGGTTIYNYGGISTRRITPLGAVWSGISSFLTLTLYSSGGSGNFIAGDIVTVSGFAVKTTYNGTYVVSSVASLGTQISVYYVGGQSGLDTGATVTHVPCLKTNWAGFTRVPSPSITMMVCSPMSGGTYTPLGIQLNTGQTANAFEIQNDLGSNLFYVNNIGTATVNHPGIAITSTDSLVLSNDTPSVIGAQTQMSPRARWRSHVWDTLAGANRSSDWILESEPIPGNPPVYTLNLRHSINGGAYSTIASWTNTIGQVLRGPLTLTDAAGTGAGSFVIKDATGNNQTFSVTDNGVDGPQTYTFPKAGTSGVTLAIASLPQTFQGTQTFSDGPGTGPGTISAIAGQNMILSTSGAGYVILPRDNIQATSTDVLVLSNDTASLIWTQTQMSPRLRFHAHVWDTVGAVDKTSDWIFENQPVPGNPPTYTFNLLHSPNGGAYVNIASWTNDAGMINWGKTDWKGIAAPALSAAGEGRIYFDSGANVFKVSENGGAYVNLVGGGGGTPGGLDTYVQYNNLGAFGGSANFIYDGTIIKALVPIQDRRDAIDSTSTDGMVLLNETAALVGAQVQMSPRLRFRSHIWDTGGAVDKSSDWILESQPVAGNPPTYTLNLRHSINGAAYTTIANWTNAAGMGVFGTLSLTDSAGTGAGTISTLNNQNLNLTTSGIGFVNCQRDNIQTTTTDAIVLRNTTAATAGVTVQKSPALRFIGSVWDTYAPAYAAGTEWFIENNPVTGNPAGGFLSVSHKRFISGGYQTAVIGAFANVIVLERIYPGFYIGSPYGGYGGYLDSANVEVNTVQTSAAGHGRISMFSNNWYISENAGTPVKIAVVDTNNAANRIAYYGADGRTFTASAALTYNGTTVLVNAYEQVQRDTLNATSTDGLIITNTTLATAPTPVQVSPRVRFHGSVWDTGAVANRTSDWIIEDQSVSGNPPIYTLFLRHSANGGAYSNVASWTNAAGMLNYGPVDWNGIGAPALSSAGQGRIYFDSGVNKFRISQNGGSYADLIGSIGGYTVPVLPKTNGVGSPYTVTSGDSLSLFTNEGAGAEVYLSLPTAVANLAYTAYCQNANGIRVTANAGDTIRIRTNVSAAAGYIRSTEVGASISMVAINATEWVVTSIVGTWTIDA